VNRSPVPSLAGQHYTVKKKNGKWRMSVDFIDLNKACKKDDFPLERVDKIVDNAAHNEMLSLLDMFSGYHQIRV
jgi:hypothetical protein